ncbi:MAG: S-layer protein domain-containing protein, partial [Candidatus Methanoperedens sp.]
MQNRNDIGLNKGGIIELMGDLKIIVADNDFLRFALSVDRKGGIEVRSTVFRETDAIPITEWTPYNFGMNIGKTSLGFYYNLDDGLGNEKLTMTQRNGRVIPENKLIYSTAPDQVNFIHKSWGKYQVVGFMADKYFAGFKGHTISNPTNSFDDISAIAQGELHKIVIDDDTKRTIAVGSTLALQEGYVLQASDIDLNARTMFLRLLKDGTEVDSTPLSKDETYVYKKRVGNVDDLPLILVRFDNVFSGQELQAAFIKGIFQLSENATTVKVGDQYGKMEVTAVNKDKIAMENSGDIGLDSNKNEVLMGNIRLKVADNSSTLRFHFAVDVTDDMIVNQLVIGAPKKVMAGDTLKVKVTAGGKAVDNSSLALDTDMGTTNKDGELNYTIPKTLKAGTYTITATKTGYEKATLNIDIEKYVDYRLSIEMPSKANQYETITINVSWNNTAMSGATVLFDNTSVGTTDSNGEVSYRLETSGTHSITASKTSYIPVSRDIDIRAPYSEFKALDINVTPNPVFTGDNFVVKSNITNVGTKSDTLPVDLIINGTVVDNRTITLTPGEKVEINFTRQEAAVSNVTVEIMGQSNLLVVQKKPISYLLIAAIATVIGAVIIYVLTSKGLLSLELLKQKFEVLSDKISNLFKK